MTLLHPKSSSEFSFIGKARTENIKKSMMDNDKRQTREELDTVVFWYTRITKYVKVKLFYLMQGFMIFL